MKELLALFFIGGLIYAIVYSPGKRLTSAIAFAGLLVGLFAAVAFDKLFSLSDSGILIASVVQLPCVLAALCHSLKAQSQAKTRSVQA